MDSREWDFPSLKKIYSSSDQSLEVQERMKKKKKKKSDIRNSRSREKIKAWTQKKNAWRCFLVNVDWVCFSFSFQFD